MRQLMKALSMGTGACLIGLMGGCASSNLVDKWHDPTYQAPPLVKMLVIAVRKDPTKRRLWEDAFVAELDNYGISATPSYSLHAMAPPDTGQIASDVQNNGFDGIVVIRKLPTEMNMHYRKGHVSVQPDSPYNPNYVPYWKRYWTDFSIVEQPGYVDTETVAIRSIDVATTGNNGRVIWNATSRTPDPIAIIDIQRGIAALVATELARRKFIGPKK